MDLISVVVITYNSSKTVTETLESIYNQTYPRLELIVSDDCSTDGTVNIVREWIKTHHKRFVSVRIIKAKKNHGVTKNCNIGLNQAKGKYVQEIAGDDLLIKDAIEKKYRFAEKNNLNAVFSKVEVFGTNIPRVRFVKRYCERGYDIIKKGWQEQYNQIIVDNFVAGPSGGFFLTEYIQTMGGYDVSYSMLEDYPFLFHYILAGNEIVLLEEELVRYRISNSSVWTSDNKDYLKCAVKFFFRERLLELMKNRQYKVAAFSLIGYLSIFFRAQ